MRAIEADFPEMKINKLARHIGESLEESQKSAGERVKHKLTNERLTSDPRYPRVKFHPVKVQVVVKDAHEEASVTPAADGWVNSPADFPPSSVREYKDWEKFLFLEEIATLLGVKEGESPLDAVIALMAERDDFARKLAILTGAEPQKKGKAKGAESESAA